MMKKSDCVYIYDVVTKGHLLWYAVHDNSERSGQSYVGEEHKSNDYWQTVCARYLCGQRG